MEPGGCKVPTRHRIKQMICTLSTHEAVDMLLGDRTAGWTPSGAAAIVEYYEELESDDEPIELDIVAIRCEWNEYASALEAMQDYGHEFDTEEEAMAYIEDRATVLTHDEGIVFVAF